MPVCIGMAGMRHRVGWARAAGAGWNPFMVRLGPPGTSARLTTNGFQRLSVNGFDRRTANGFDRRSANGFGRRTANESGRTTNGGRGVARVGQVLQGRGGET